MNLEELNSIEKHLNLEIKKTSGLIEEKFEQFRQRGIFNEYLKVFTEYFHLIESEDEEIEALKRAVFLKWYESAEPSFLSGINDLPKDIGYKVLEQLDEKHKKEDLDFEFQWMLSHYILIAEYVFTDFTNIKSFPIIESKEIWGNPDFDTTQFENRGQMGTYWISVIESNKKQLNWNKRIQNK